MVVRAPEFAWLAVPWHLRPHIGVSLPATLEPLVSFSTSTAWATFVGSLRCC
jgi:hypothetical protein